MTFPGNENENYQNNKKPLKSKRFFMAALICSIMVVCAALFCLELEKRRNDIEIVTPPVTEVSSEPEQISLEPEMPVEAEPEAMEPEALEEPLEPEALEPDAIEPEVTDPEVTEPEIIEAEITEPVEAPEPVPKIVLERIEELRKEYSNNDIVGFLEIKGTNISYPVVHGSDNEFYLEHNINGETDIYGTIFMDYENDPVELGKNTVIYGHNMRNGSMFHNLRYYLEKSYFDEHPVINLTTLYEETTWEIFSFCHTTTDFYYIQTKFEDDKDFLGLLIQMKMNSIYETGVSAGKEDKVLTLSTCANEGGINRYALFAKLVDDEADENKADENKADIKM